MNFKLKYRKLCICDGNIIEWECFRIAQLVSTIIYFIQNQVLSIRKHLKRDVGTIIILLKLII